jgi:hypothetical protein
MYLYNRNMGRTWPTVVVTVEFLRSLTFWAKACRGQIKGAVRRRGGSCGWRRIRMSFGVLFEV